VNPKDDMSVFNQDPELLKIPVGFDAIEVMTTTTPPDDVDFRHFIPEDTIPDSEAGREKQVQEIPVASQSNAEKTTQEEEAANYKARILEREMRKLDTEWNPTNIPSMDRATVIETDVDGKEKTR
jgi:hypothetical protein